MTWREIEDACYAYAVPTKYCDSASVQTYKVDILTDFLKVYSCIKKEQHADLKVFKEKMEKWREYPTIERWYEEHIKGTMEHEIAGVIMKLAIFTKHFKLDVSAITTEMSADISLEDMWQVLPMPDVYMVVDLVYNAIRDVIKAGSSDVLHMMHILPTIGSILSYFNIKDIETYISIRLEYAYLKAIRNGTKFK